MYEDVSVGLAESGYTPVGRRRGACGSGPFPAAPGPNRTGTFQRIRLSSGFSRTVRGWLPPAACTQDFRHRFGVLHYAYLLASVILNRLAPFALRAAFPPSLAGRYSRDYYGASVTVGLASGR